MQLKILMLIIAILSFSGCTTVSPTSSFYTLSPMAVAHQTATPHTTLIGVGPVRIPDYLDQSGIIFHIDSTRLQKAEFDRWGGDLKQNITDVIAENLSKLLVTDTVVTEPWSRNVPVAQQVALDVRRFEMAADGKVHLVAQWQLVDASVGNLLKLKREHISVQVTEKDYAQQVQAMSVALAELSQRIATVVRSLK